MIVAPLPGGIRGHFGLKLCRFGADTVRSGPSDGGACSATIRVACHLPHPGMLPSWGPVASPECSHSTIAATGASISAPRGGRTVLCLNHGLTHEAVRWWQELLDRDRPPLVEHRPSRCRASCRGAHPARRYTPTGARGVRTRRRATAVAAIVGQQLGDADDRHPLCCQPTGAVTSLPFRVAECALASRLVVVRHVQPPLRNAVQWGWHGFNHRWRGPEHKLMRLVPPPVLEPTLQGPQQSNRVGSRLFILKPLKQLACGPPRLGLKPSMQLHRHRYQRIRTTPATFGLLLWSTGWAHLTLPPCRSQTRQELLQRWSGRRKLFTRGRTVGNLHQLLLASPDRVQQLHRVKSGVKRRPHAPASQPPCVGPLSAAGAAWPVHNTAS